MGFGAQLWGPGSDSPGNWPIMALESRTSWNKNHYVWRVCNSSLQKDKPIQVQNIGNGRFVKTKKCECGRHPTKHPHYMSVHVGRTINFFIKISQKYAYFLKIKYCAQQFTSYNMLNILQILENWNESW